jgi:hypothetical protein
MSLCFRGPSVPKHTNGNERRAKHHDTHPVFRFSDSVVSLRHLLTESVVRTSHNDQSGEEADSAAEIRQPDKTFAPTVHSAEYFREPRILIFEINLWSIRREKEIDITENDAQGDCERQNNWAENEELTVR